MPSKLIGKRCFNLGRLDPGGCNSDVTQTSHCQPWTPSLRDYGQGVWDCALSIFFFFFSGKNQKTRGRYLGTQAILASSSMPSAVRTHSSPLFLTPAMSDLNSCLVICSQLVAKWESSATSLSFQVPRLGWQKLL